MTEKKESEDLDSHSSDKPAQDLLNIKDETSKNKKRLEEKKKMTRQLSRVLIKPKYLFMIKDTIMGKFNTTSVKRSSS